MSERMHKYKMFFHTPFGPPLPPPSLPKKNLRPLQVRIFSLKEGYLAIGPLLLNKEEKER